MQLVKLKDIVHWKVTTYAIEHENILTEISLASMKINYYKGSFHTKFKIGSRMVYNKTKMF